jgi:hypothetical protein
MLSADIRVFANAIRARNRHLIVGLAVWIGGLADQVRQWHHRAVMPALVAGIHVLKTYG